MGPRERADVILPPFEMAVREGRPRSVMHAYTDTDGIPCAADEWLLTELLRDTWGFTGTVVADYFGIAFLKTLHGVAGDWAHAAGLALVAGVDVELPTVKTFGQPLLDAVASGAAPEALIDWALRRVLVQKIQLGLLDPTWSPVSAALAEADLSDAQALRGSVDLDRPANRSLAGQIAEQAVVLLRNDGILPLRGPLRIALIGPNADEPTAVLGCYAFPVHVGGQYPRTPLGIELPTLREALASEFTGGRIRTALGTSVDGGEDSGFAERCGSRAAPTSWCSLWATAPGSLAAAPAARAATRPRRGFRALSSGCSTLCWMRGHPSWSPCWPGGPTHWGGR
ncbi:beta-glucosidase-like glycosyl hydrolase [Kitasatospora kifunensis]|uniref:Beta-glucosidase-like glycosyl hydrolase n=1 Tax=Kitasatospora kifunensis TaxID=58351 RepID=A0A7W7RA09_KITKI|nr:beta-glucosidase-like glycosyl hydrolase [Kitasatospora kifunensis]